MAYTPKGFRTTFKDWLLIVGVSALTLTVVVTVMMGIQAIIIDTGRAIVH